MARQNKILALILKVSVSLLLLFVLISKTGLERLIQTIREVSLLSFLTSALIYILSVFISSIRWRLLLMKSMELKRLFSLYLIGSFFNNLMPGIIGGDAVKAYYLNKALKERYKGQEGEDSSLLTRNLSLSLASVFMDRYTGFVSLLVIAIIAYPLGSVYFRGSYIEWILPGIIAAFVLGSLILFYFRLGRRIGFLAGFYEYLRYYKGEKGVLLRCLSLSLLLQIVIICSAFVISKGLGMQVPFYFFSIIIPIISVISSIPLSISGLGVREASFVLLLSPLGVSHAQAITLSLAWFLSFAAGSLPGFFLYIRLRAKGSETT